MNVSLLSCLPSLLLAALLSPVATVHAQVTSWPERPVRIVNPFPAGGASDTLTRIMAEELQKRLGQSFVVDNRTGASGNIGMEAGARAAPDGYTLLSATIGTLTINQHLYSRLPYDPQTLSPVSTFWGNCNAVLVPAQLNPSRTLGEFLTWARAQPKGISFGSSGVGTTPHLSGELLKMRTGITALHVPTRGGPQTTALLVAGDIDVAIDNIASYAGLLASGQVRALAVTCPERWPNLPDVPTMAEAGVPDFVITSWGAFVAPPGTPAAIVEKLSRTMREVAADEAVQKRFMAVGARLTSSPPAETSAFIARERARWGELIRAVGVKVE